MKKYIILSVLVLCLFVGVKAEDVGLIVTPSHIMNDIFGEQNIEQTLKIINNRANKEKILVKSREVGIDRDGNFFVPSEFDIDDPSFLEQSGWLSFDPKEFYLDVGESKEVKVIISIPSENITKGYYTELVFTTEIEEVNDDVGLAPEVAVPIAINYFGIDGQVRNLEFLEFYTDRNFYEYTKVHFFTHLENKGNVHIIPKGQIFISKDKDMKDVKETIDFNNGNKTVFSGAGRKFEHTWMDGFFYIDNDENFQINWNKVTDIKFGKYYAQLSLVWDGNEGKEFAIKTVSFWIIPWKLLLVVFSIIILTIIILLKMIKKKKGDKLYYRNG